ncbi:MAG: hypothetical protein QNJ22_05465 [Desulfosarcinaceae bacterium]|nr:hypothetical protein [Desulfosarcinaceae bacterium]
MTPYEVAKTLHRELAPLVPKLAAALNRALVEIGEGSSLVGLGPGTHKEDHVSFQEYEAVELQGAQPAEIIARITNALQVLGANSSWEVLIDKKSTHGKDRMELMYTIYRMGRKM